MQGEAHDPNVKAAVVAALLAGQSISFVAKQYNLPRSTVANWAGSKRSMLSDKSADNDRQEVTNLLFDLLRANLRALIAQAEVSAEKDYLRKQSGENLALLQGVLHDKTVRMLEAMTSGENDEPTGA